VTGGPGVSHGGARAASFAGGRPEPTVAGGLAAPQSDAPVGAFASLPSLAGLAGLADRAMLAAVAAIVGVVPLAVNPWWYDRYYWPKIQLLYAATALGALGALALLCRGRPAPLARLRSPVGLALLAWLAMLTVATVASVDPLTSVVGDDYRYEGLLTWLAYGAAAALAAAALVTAARVRAIVSIALGAAVAISVLGLLQHWGWQPVPTDFERTGWNRAWGTTGNPLALGAYLVLLLPVAASLYAAEPTARGVRGAVVVILYAALVASLARGAWGALPVGLVACGAALGSRVLRAAARPLLLLAVCCAVVTPVVLLTGPAQRAPDRAAVAYSANGRWFLWKTSAPLVRERPLLGWGPETLATTYPAYGTPQFFAVYPGARTTTLIVDRPHNDLLQQAIATGLVGLAAYLWLWAALVRTAWRAARTGRTPGAAALGAGLFGGFVAYFAQLQVLFSYVSVAPVFWVLVGVLLALDGDAPPGAPGGTRSRSTCGGARGEV